MNKTRLEAFSDGVLAILITIMVLEIKIPHGGTFSDLAPIIPTFFSYLLSFVFIGIYWGNHHHLLHIVKHVNTGIMLSNLHLLFWLSLVPLATEWMGENNFTPHSVALYLTLLDLCGVAYYILQQKIVKSHVLSESMKKALAKQKIKGLISVAAYTSGIGIAFVSPFIAQLIYIITAIIWLIPDKNIERAMSEK